LKIPADAWAGAIAFAATGKIAKAIQHAVAQIRRTLMAGLPGGAESQIGVPFQSSIFPAAIHQHLDAIEEVSRYAAGDERFFAPRVKVASPVRRGERGRRVVKAGAMPIPPFAKTLPAAGATFAPLVSCNTAAFAQ
jgi:hypothetical protein